MYRYACSGPVYLNHIWLDMKCFTATWYGSDMLSNYIRMYTNLTLPTIHCITLHSRSMQYNTNHKMLMLSNAILIMLIIFNGLLRFVIVSYWFILIDIHSYSYTWTHVCSGVVIQSYTVIYRRTDSSEWLYD